MLRILSFILVIFLLGLGFAWLADRPGDLVVTFNGYQYQVTLMVAASAVVTVVAAVMLLWWLLKSLWNSPYAIARHFRARRRDRGYQALSTGMIAAGAGDAATARRMGRQAAKLISADQEPLIHLLDAQTLLLEGEHEGAREKFRAMLDDPELRALALRGLYLEAERLGHRDAARHYAAEAVRVAPQLAWASDVSLEEMAEKGEWDAALKLLDAQRATGRTDRHAAGRRRAVLLTAQAMAALDADPLAAKNAALEANRLAPDLVPAAVTAARALFRLNDLKRGSKILEAAWKLAPHPDIAEAYVHARPGDSTRDRLTRAERLGALRPNNAQSALAVARAALDAGEFARARSEAEAAIRLMPCESAYLLRADIEEAETGDQGRVRGWLQKAVRAPRDAAWVADGQAFDRWAPVSPISGRLDAFEWREPVERPGTAIEAMGGRAELPSPDGSEGKAASTGTIDHVAAAVSGETAADTGAGPTAPGEGGDGTRPPSATPAGETMPAASAEERARNDGALVEGKEAPALPGPPDDPGVEGPGAQEEAPRKPASGRFRLF